MIGQTVAHYENTDKIGAGGMGEVYRATDARLNREVALKVLPQVFAQDAQRMGRFEREAQVLASLNHPNTTSIYGLEDSNGTRVLVMELVEGEDLSERIAGMTNSLWGNGLSVFASVSSHLFPFSIPNLRLPATRHRNVVGSSATEMVRETGSSVGGYIGEVEP